MSLTLAQIFALNPKTVVADTDLFYLVNSPYTAGTDAGITGASLKAAFGTGGTVNAGLINQLAFYAASGNTISGLTTANNGVLVTSAGGVPSISSTIPNAVQDNITRLGTIVSMTTPLSGTFGGTGVNNGASLITVGGNFSMSGAFTFTGTLTGNTAVTFPITGTLATTSQIPTGAALTKTDDTNVTLTLGGSPTTALVNAASLTLGWTGQLGLTRGGTAASLTASNGGIVYSNASTLAILAGTATAGQMLRSGLSSAPTWSTATFPATAGTSGNVLTSDGTNFISSAPASQAGRLINVQVFTATGTYTKTTGAITAIVKLVGSGGGGAGSGSAGGGTGGTPTANTFGAILTANGGVGGVFQAGTGSAGGTASGANIANLQGGAGQGLQVSGASYVLGGIGGNSYFGGGAAAPAASATGITAGANTGAGGSGGSGNGSTTAPGSGGGAGAYCEHFWTIASPQTVTLNNGGTGGTAGTSGVAGGAGAKGICIVYEYS